MVDGLGDMGKTGGRDTSSISMAIIQPRDNRGLLEVLTRQIKWKGFFKMLWKGRTNINIGTREREE